MLSLEDPNDNSQCVYEPKSIMLQKRETRGNVLASKRKLKSFKTYEKEKNFTKAVMLQKSNFSKTKEVPVVEDDKNSLAVVESSDRNEDNSKAFIGSFGSWINDLFNGNNHNN